MDHVPVIDHVTVLAIAAGPAAHESEHARATDEQLDAIVKQMSPRTVTDQPRGDRIKYLAQDEAARSAHVHQLLFVVGGAVIRQRL